MIDKFVCPKCNCPTYCRCESWDDRIPEEYKPYYYFNIRPNCGLIRCYNCGFELSEDEWLDAWMEQYKNDRKK